MMDLQTFPTLFPKAKAVDGETFDIRFEEAVSLAEQDQFEEAVPLIEQILTEGCLDIRLIMHLFYAHFLKEGIQSFTQIFPLIITLIDKQWELISPIKMRESHTSKSIVWFFSTIVKRMKRSIDVRKKDRDDSFWARSAALPAATLEEVERLAKELIEFFTYTWKLPSCHQHTQYLLRWIGEVKSTLPPPPKEVKQEKEKKEEAAPHTSEIKKEETLPPPTPMLSPPAPAPQKTLSPLEEILLGSEKMKELNEKIEVFKALIEKSNFTKGALVGNDIKNTIENFNPATFFPKLFSEYYALIAKYIDTFSSEWEGKGSPKWESLEQLYQTDLEAFIKW